MSLRVALTVGREPAGRHSLHRGYADSVWRAGAIPVVVPPPPAAVGELIERFVETALSCDALCLTGGGDVDPRQYGEAPTAELLQVDDARDCAELAAVRAAVEVGLPVLGICRGVQVIAVALGGRLHQDLMAVGHPGHWADEREDRPAHEVTALRGSLAAAALGGAIDANSIHHQAVRDSGPTLVATAWSGDGVIEAVETDRVLGLQWHPERLADADARHLAPFRWLVGSRLAA